MPSFSLAKQTQIPILMYHALDESHSIIATPPATFASQMRWLYENDYHVIPLSHLVQHLHRRTSLPARSIVITFDDGFESIYTVAFPILARYGFSATVFLVAGYCGGSNNWPHQPQAILHHPLLTWAQVREMDGQGIEFGAHTMNHPWLDQLTPGEIEYEVLSSKAQIEEQIGHPIDLFAYPYGRYNEEVRTIVGRAYAGACSTRLGMAGPRSDLFALERIEMLYLAHPLLFRQLSNPSFPLYLLLRRWLRTTAATILKRPWK
jgi:peptidoglycan/xylan/chitin deacetylase (PgdA/CDA1 family)